MVFSLDPGMPGDLILPIILSKHMTSSYAQSMSVFHPREHSWRSRLSITGAKLLCYVLVRDCHSGKRMKLLNVSKGPLNWDTIARGAVLRDCHLSLPRASQVCSNLQTLEMLWSRERLQLSCVRAWLSVLRFPLKLEIVWVCSRHCIKTSATVKSH